jgi:hypothetical protein
MADAEQDEDGEHPGSDKDPGCRTAEHVLEQFVSSMNTCMKPSLTGSRMKDEGKIANPSIDSTR